MENMYFFEVPYMCKCEECGNEISGIIKRGPLQVGSNILTTGMQVAMNSAEMKLSKRIIENALENETGNGFSASEYICPKCNARQSWKPMTKPKKPSHIGSYILSLIFFPLVGMGIWGIFFFDAIIPFILLVTIGAFIGFFLPYRSHKKHKAQELEEYNKLTKEYEEYIEQMKNRKTHNKPEIEWEKAKFVPI